MSASKPAATRRADAERNRAKILAAAAEAFACGEAEVSLAEIARKAGVGMATVYRNFPSRRELLEALYADEVAAVCAAAAEVPGDTPGERLAAWLREFFAFSSRKRHIAAELLTHVDRDDAVFDDNRARVIATGRELFDAARDAGEVRADLEVEQVLDMVIAVARIQGDRAYLEPILQTTLDGLRPA